MVRKFKQYSVNHFIKELRATIKLSSFVENGSTGLSEQMWKSIVDNYIYGVRRYLVNDKTNKLEVYNKYGVLRSQYQFRKQSFLHWGFVKGKIQNVNEFNSSSFRERIYNCRKVQDAIQEDLASLIQKDANLSEEDIKNRKRMIETDIKQNLDLLETHFSKVGLLSLAMSCHYMFRHMFEGIIFDNKFIEFVRNHDYRQGPIIFLPTHKSYMDFMILSYLLVMRDARPPLIGAADNMNNILLVSRLFKLTGAFYIKRTGQKFPKIYRAILNEFMKSILENEMNMEFFMEATRSRTGQILYPKFGMLKYVVEAYIEKRIPDAIIIPLNITYENIIEADSYIVEHRGSSKVAEDTLRMIKSVRLVYKNFGKMIINSAEPISLKRYIDWHDKENGGVHLLKTSQEDEFVTRLGLHLTNILQEKSVFMHTHLMSVILLMRQHYQLVKDIESSIRILTKHIKDRGGTIFEVEDGEFNFDSAIKCFRGRLSIRGDTFNERRVCIDRANYIENCLALKYYSNSMNYLFFLEGLIYFSATQQMALEKTVSVDRLWYKVQLLQKMFGKEIFLKAWIQSKEEMIALAMKQSFFRMLSDQECEIILDLPREELLLIEFYNTQIPPIFAGYMTAFICAAALNTEEPTETEKWILTAQNLAELSHKMGVIQSPTFCSIFYMRQAYTYLLDSEIIQEKSVLKGEKIRKCFWVKNQIALEMLIKALRVDFLWEENYKIIRKVFEDRYLKHPSNPFALSQPQSSDTPKPQPQAPRQRL